MKNLIKSVLATLMLMSLFSTSTIAWISCDGLNGYSGYGGDIDYDDKSSCEKFQSLYGNTDRNWIGQCGIIRKTNEEWNGTNEFDFIYTGGKWPSSFSCQRKGSPAVKPTPDPRYSLPSSLNYL